MYRNSVLKQFIIFIIGSAVNLGMFCLSKYAGFPVWADYAGSVYITAIAGPVAGGISVVLHTLLLVLLIDGSYALWLALPALCICTLIYIFRIKEIRLSFKNMCAFGCMASLLTFVSLYLSFIPTDVAGRRAVLAAIITDRFTCMLAAAGVALLESCLTVAVFFIVYLLTPKNDDKLIFKR